MQKINSQRSEKEAAKMPIKKKIAKKPPVPMSDPEELFEEEEEQEEEEHEIEGEDEVTEEEEEQEKPNETDKILMNIERLHNDGLFRYELLLIANKIASELQVLNYQLRKAFGDGKERDN